MTFLGWRAPLTAGSVGYICLVLLLLGCEGGEDQTSRHGVLPPCQRCTESEEWTGNLSYSAADVREAASGHWEGAYAIDDDFGPLTVIADVVLDDGEGRELLPAGRGLELPACAPNEHLECQGLALAGAIAVSSSRPSFSAQYRAVRVGALELACNEPVGDVPHGCVAVEFDDLRETHPDSAWLVFGSNDVLWLGLPEGTTMRYTQIGTRTSRIASD